jgi:hypothetical protein
MEVSPRHSLDASSGSGQMTCESLGGSLMVKNALKTPQSGNDR